MMGLLTTYAPLLVKLGISLIDMFTKGDDNKVKAKKEYLQILQVNINRQIEILKMTNNVDEQLNNLRNK